MSASRLFGGGAVGAVTVVETPVSQSYARRAWLALLTAGPVCGLLVAVVLASFAPVVLAVAVGAVSGVVCGVLAALLVRAWPVLRVLWWWAAEIAVATVVLAMVVTLSRLSHPLVAVVAVLVVVLVVALVRPVCNRLAAWSWCAVVRHRLRLCFAEFVRAVSRTRPGTLPLILLARPTLAGERVWVWLRPGLELGDLDGKTGKLAVACWASEVRVVRASKRYAALIRVDITRRDPLTGLVASPLSLLVPDWARTDRPTVTGLPATGLDLDDVPEPPPVAESRGARR